MFNEVDKCKNYVIMLCNYNNKKVDKMSILRKMIRENPQSRQSARPVNSIVTKKVRGVHWIMFNINRESIDKLQLAQWLGKCRETIIQYQERDGWTRWDEMALSWTRQAIWYNEWIDRIYYDHAKKSANISESFKNNESTKHIYAMIKERHLSL